MYLDTHGAPASIATLYLNTYLGVPTSCPAFRQELRQAVNKALCTPYTAFRTCSSTLPSHCSCAILCPLLLTYSHLLLHHIFHLHFLRIKVSRILFYLPFSLSLVVQ